MRIHRIPFYLTILLLPAQLGRHFWPDWTIVLGRRVDFLSPTIYLTDLTVLTTLVLWFLQWAFGITRNGKQPKIEKKTKFTSFAVMVVMALNCWFSVVPLHSLYVWMRLILMFGLYEYVVQTKPDYVKTLSLLGIPIVYSSFLGIMQFLVHHSIGGVWWLFGERSFSLSTPGIAKLSFCLPAFLGNPVCPVLLRSYGTFSHPNVLGGFLVIATPLFMNASRKKTSIQRIIAYMGVSLAAFALIMTFSRSSWVILLMWLFIYASRLHIRCPISFARIILLCLGVLAGTYILSTLNPASESVNMRLSLFNSAINMFRSHPICGVGLGNFVYYLPKVTTDRSIFFLQPVHNIIALIVSETGIIGCILFSYFFFPLLKLLMRQCSKFATDNSLGIESIAIPLSVIGLLLLGQIDHYIMTSQQGLLMFTVIISFAFIASDDKIGVPLNQ